MKPLLYVVSWMRWHGSMNGSWLSIMKMIHKAVQSYTDRLASWVPVTDEAWVPFSKW